MLLCSSREVPSSGLYGRRSSAQSRYFLIINIHKIGAKVRSVELTVGKILNPICILAMHTLPWPQRTPKMYSSRAQRAVVEALWLYKDNAPLLPCAGSNGAAIEHNVTNRGRYSSSGITGHHWNWTPVVI